MSEVFTNKLNILKALAILLVVSGHLEFSLIPMFPPYSFQVVLFFFIAGMVYKDKYSFFEYFKRRFKSLMVPYILYAAVYLVITILITPVTGKFWGLPVTFKNEFIMPFLTGHQLALISPLWFVPQLFTTLIVYKLLDCIKINKYVKTAFFVIIALIAVKLGDFRQNYYILYLLRTMFSLLFVDLGRMYKNEVENKINIFSPKMLAFVLVLQSVLWLTNKDYTPIDGIGLSYVLVWGEFDDLFIPLITSFTGIWMSLYLVEILYDKVKGFDFLQKIGQNTYHIMANHLFVFNFITYSILFFKGIPFDIKNSHDIYWFYAQLKTTYFYFIFGLAATTYLGEFLKYIHERINNVCLKYKNKLD